MARPTNAVLLALCALAALTVSGCSGGGADAGATVHLRNNEFDPKALTVASGDEVHFEVEEGRHAISIHKAGTPPNELLLEESDLSAGADTHFAFPSTGTYHVWCPLHGTMTTGMAMVVTVE